MLVYLLVAAWFVGFVVTVFVFRAFDSIQNGVWVPDQSWHSWDYPIVIGAVWPAVICVLPFFAVMFGLSRLFALFERQIVRRLERRGWGRRVLLH